MQTQTQTLVAQQTSQGTLFSRQVASFKKKHVEIPLQIKPFSSEKVRFSGDMGRMPLPKGETRDLHFYIMDLQFKSAVERNNRMGDDSDS